MRAGFILTATLFLSVSSCSSAPRKPGMGNGINPVFHVPAGRLAPDQLWFLSEIDRGTFRKYEYRTSTGAFFLDRVLCPRKVAGEHRFVHLYPVAYGISPGRFNVDGDPLDLNVLGVPTEDQPGVARIVRVIGMMKFDECEEVPCRNDWKQDWKVLAVEDGDPAYEHVADVSQLQDTDKKAIKEFFSSYKGPKKDSKGREHPQTRVGGFLGKEETLALIAKDFQLVSEENRAEEIESCTDRYDELAEAKPQPVMNREYLGCLQRVANPHALPGSPVFEFFLAYNAGMRLLGLGEEGVTLESSLARMEMRKNQGKNYYRFVGRDLPAPGTGAKVYEWVETKDRNKGCPADFPPQHYEARPLVDRQ